MQYSNTFAIQLLEYPIPGPRPGNMAHGVITGTKRTKYHRYAGVKTTGKKYNKKTHIKMLKLYNLINNI